MTEAALFYEEAKAGLGTVFFDDVQHAIDTVRQLPNLAKKSHTGFAVSWLAVFRSPSSTPSKRTKSLLSRLRIKAGVLITGKGACDC